MRLTVGILAYNSERMLPDLLASLPAGLAGVDDWHLVIADGASSDATLEVARRLAPEAAAVSLGANRGFAAAANGVIGFDPSTDAVLILSPTVRLSPGCVRPMLAALSRPDAGIAVPRLLRGTGRPFPSLRRRPTLLRAWGEALLGGGIASRIGALSELIAGPETYTSQTRADWAPGAVRPAVREQGPALRPAAPPVASQDVLGGSRAWRSAARRDATRADPPRRGQEAAARTTRAGIRPARPDLARGGSQPGDAGQAVHMI